MPRLIVSNVGSGINIGQPCVILQVKLMLVRNFIGLPTIKFSVTLHLE